MPQNPTIYLTDEEYRHLDEKYPTISGGIRSLVQADMEGQAND